MHIVSGLGIILDYLDGPEGLRKKGTLAANLPSP